MQLVNLRNKWLQRPCLVLGRQEAAEERTKVVSIARPTPKLTHQQVADQIIVETVMGPRSKEIGSARLSAREQTEASQTSNTGGATPNQIKMLTTMCAERGLDFDPTAPMTYSEAKDMFLAIKPIPKVK